MFFFFFYEHSFVSFLCSIDGIRNNSYIMLDNFKDNLTAQSFLYEYCFFFLAMGEYSYFLRFQAEIFLYFFYLCFYMAKK